METQEANLFSCRRVKIKYEGRNNGIAVQHSEQGNEWINMDQVK